MDNVVEDSPMTSSTRYYLLHREQKNAERLARYHSKPEVIAKKEAREQKKAEQKKEKEAKQQAHEQKLQERIQLAMETKKSSTKVS